MRRLWPGNGDFFFSLPCPSASHRRVKVPLLCADWRYVCIYLNNPLVALKSQAHLLSSNHLPTFSLSFFFLFYNFGERILLFLLYLLARRRRRKRRRVLVFSPYFFLLFFHRTSFHSPSFYFVFFFSSSSYLSRKFILRFFSPVRKEFSQVHNWFRFLLFFFFFPPSFLHPHKTTNNTLKKEKKII